MSWWQLEEKSLNILKTIPNMTKCEKETSNNCLMGIKSPTYKCKHHLFSRQEYIHYQPLPFFSSLYIYVGKCISLYLLSVSPNDLYFMQKLAVLSLLEKAEIEVLANTWCDHRRWEQIRAVCVWWCICLEIFMLHCFDFTIFETCTRQQCSKNNKII